MSASFHTFRNIGINIEDYTKDLNLKKGQTQHRNSPSSLQEDNLIHQTRDSAQNDSSIEIPLLLRESITEENIEEEIKNLHIKNNKILADISRIETEKQKMEKSLRSLRKTLPPLLKREFNKTPNEIKLEEDIDLLDKSIIQSRFQLKKNIKTLNMLNAQAKQILLRKKDMPKITYAQKGLLYGFCVGICSGLVYQIVDVFYSCFNSTDKFICLSSTIKSHGAIPMITITIGSLSGGSIGLIYETAKKILKKRQTTL